MSECVCFKNLLHINFFYYCLINAHSMHLFVASRISYISDTCILWHRHVFSYNWRAPIYWFGLLSAGQRTVRIPLALIYWLYTSLATRLHSNGSTTPFPVRVILSFRIEFVSYVVLNEKKIYISNSVKSVRKWKNYLYYIYKWKIYMHYTNGKYTIQMKYFIYNTNGNYTMQMKNIKYKFKLWK